MAPHSSTLAWKIPWTEEPGGLQSMGLQRVRHDWATALHFLMAGYSKCSHGPAAGVWPGRLLEMQAPRLQAALPTRNLHLNKVPRWLVGTSKSETPSHQVSRQMMSRDERSYWEDSIPHASTFCVIWLKSWRKHRRIVMGWSGREGQRNEHRSIVQLPLTDNASVARGGGLWLKARGQARPAEPGTCEASRSADMARRSREPVGLLGRAGCDPFLLSAFMKTFLEDRVSGIDVKLLFVSKSHVPTLSCFPENMANVSDGGSGWMPPCAHRFHLPLSGMAHRHAKEQTSSHLQFLRKFSQFWVYNSLYHRWAPPQWKVARSNVDSVWRRPGRKWRSQVSFDSGALKCPSHWNKEEFTYVSSRKMRSPPTSGRMSPRWHVHHLLTSALKPFPPGLLFGFSFGLAHGQREWLWQQKQMDPRDVWSYIFLHVFPFYNATSFNGVMNEG